jgi:hypothetical protein
VLRLFVRLEGSRCFWAARIDLRQRLMAFGGRGLPPEKRHENELESVTVTCPEKACQPEVEFSACGVRLRPDLPAVLRLLGLK